MGWCLGCPALECAASFDDAGRALEGHVQPKTLAAGWRNSYIMTSSRCLLQMGVADLSGGSQQVLAPPPWCWWGRCAAALFVLLLFA